MNQTQNRPKVSIKTLIGVIIIFIFIFCLPFLRILGQKDTGNIYVYLLNGIFEFIVAFLFGYILFKKFEDIKLLGNIKSDLIKLIFIIILYWILSSFIIANISSSFGNLSLNIKNIELKYLLIPTFSISILFIFRLFNYAKNPIDLKFIKIDSQEISDVTKDIIIGIIIVTITTTVLFSEGIYPLSNLLGFLILPNTIVVLFFSVITSFIEFFIFYFEKFFPQELNELKELFNKNYLKGLVFYSIIFFIISASFLYFMNTPTRNSYSHCFDIKVANFSFELINRTDNSLIKTEKEVVIPIINIYNYQYPLTDKILELSKSGIFNLYYENQSLSVKIDTSDFRLNYSLTFNYTENPNITFGIEKPAYDIFSFPPQYDNIVLYALYKNGYSYVNYYSTFTDIFVRAEAEKVFFNLGSDDNNIAIVINLQGGTYILDNYNIAIVSKNTTLSNSIKDFLISYAGKAQIFIVNEDPKSIFPLNC